MKEGESRMRRIGRFIASLLIVAASVAVADEETDGVRRCYGSLTAYRMCISTCADQLFDAQGMCESMWPGWRSYCEIRASEEYVECTNMCYINMCWTA